MSSFVAFHLFLFFFPLAKNVQQSFISNHHICWFRGDVTWCNVVWRRGGLHMADKHMAAVVCLASYLGLGQ